MGDHYRQQMGSFGADCQPGYNESVIFGIKTGICVPNAETVAQGIITGGTGTYASGAAQSPTVIQAGQNALASGIGHKIVSFYKDKPLIAFGATAAVVAFFVYGVMSWGKK
jgi:hypothetical protein